MTAYLGHGIDFNQNFTLFEDKTAKTIGFYKTQYQEMNSVMITVVPTQDQKEAKFEIEYWVDGIEE